jgi:hypothetical protein
VDSVQPTARLAAVPHVPTRDGLVAQPSRLRSPVARAVVPVLGGLVVLAAIMGITWLSAALISGGGADTSDRLAPDTFRVGNVETIAAIVAEDGPILFPGLNTTTGERTLVLDHDGDDPTSGWRVHWAYPADRDATCLVEQTPGTATFTDCAGRSLDVSELAPPTGVNPVVENRSVLSIDLRGAVAETAATTG